MSEITGAAVRAPVAETCERRLGCPVANGVGPCNHLCGGGWPGTRITHDKMLRALRAGRLIPRSLGCGPLQDQALHWYLRHSDN